MHSVAPPPPPLINQGEYIPPSIYPDNYGYAGTSGYQMNLTNPANFAGYDYQNNQPQFMQAYNPVMNQGKCY